MKSIKGTKTEQNLLTAFAGESQARNRYTYFASVAKKEGYEQIAGIFLETADQEKEHAKKFFKYLEGGCLSITASFPAGVIGTTEENLKAAAMGENEEWTEMYPEFARIADEEGIFPTWPDKNISASPTPTTSLRNTCGRWESRSSSACPRGTKTPMWRSTWGAKLPSRWAKRVPPSNSDEGSGVQRNGPAPPGQQGGGATAPGKAAGLRRSGESLPLRAIALHKK